MINPQIVIIAAIALLLAAMTVYAAVLIANGISLKSISGHINAGYQVLNESYHDRRLAREAKRNTKTISIDMSIADKVELYLIDKSNIRRYIPFMSFYVLIAISGAIFVGLYGVVYRILYFAPTTIVLCGIFAAIPFMILDLLGRYNSEIVRRRLADFLSVLLRWCAVKEDIFFAFERSIDSGIGEPLKSYIRDMVIQVKRGMDPVQALDILLLKVDSELFKDFILNIKQCLKRQGNIIKLLSNMEEQFYSIEREYNRRKISTYRDRLIILCVMFGVLIVGYALLQMPQVNAFYMGTIHGKLLLLLFAVLYAAGFRQFTKINKFNH